MQTIGDAQSVRDLAVQLGESLPEKASETDWMHDPRTRPFLDAKAAAVDFLLEAVDWDGDVLAAALDGPRLPQWTHQIVLTAHRRAERSVADPSDAGEHLARAALLRHEEGVTLHLNPKSFRPCDVVAAIEMLSDVAARIEATWDVDEWGPWRGLHDEDDARLALIMFEPTMPDRRHP